MPVDHSFRKNLSILDDLEFDFYVTTGRVGHYFAVLRMSDQRFLTFRAFNRLKTMGLAHVTSPRGWEIELWFDFRHFAGEIMESSDWVDEAMNDAIDIITEF